MEHSKQEFFEGTRTFGDLIVTNEFLEDSEYRSRIFHSVVKAKGAPSCTVLIVHGFCEHSQRYLDFASMLAEQSIEVHMFDFRGQGLSSGPRFAGSLKNYFEDFVLILSRIPKGLPLFIIAHSMGGGIVTSFLRQNNHIPLAGVILSNPFIDFPTYAKANIFQKLAILSTPKFLNVDSPARRLQRHDQPRPSEHRDRLHRQDVEGSFPPPRHHAQGHQEPRSSFALHAQPG